MPEFVYYSNLYSLAQGKVSVTETLEACNRTIVAPYLALLKLVSADIGILLYLLHLDAVYKLIN